MIICYTYSQRTTALNLKGSVINTHRHIYLCLCRKTTTIPSLIHQKINSLTPRFNIFHAHNKGEITRRRRMRVLQKMKKNCARICKTTTIYKKNESNLIFLTFNSCFFFIIIIYVYMKWGKTHAWKSSRCREK